MKDFFELQKQYTNQKLDSLQIFTAAQKFGMWISRRSFITKLIGGALLSAPLIFGGIFGHFVYLIMGGIMLAAFYLPTILFVDSLGGKIAESKEANKMLKGFVDIYYTCMRHLKEIEIEFEFCVDELHREIESIRLENQEFKKQNDVLGSSNEEYKKLNQKLSLKIDALNTTIQSLAENLELSKEQKEEFFQRLKDFIEEKGQSFDRIFERFGKAERSLEAERQKFADLSLKYEELYSLFEKNIKILTIDLEWLDADIRDIKDTRQALSDELEKIKKLLQEQKVSPKKDRKFLAELTSKENDLSTAVKEKDKELLKKSREFEDLSIKVKESSKGIAFFQEGKKLGSEISNIFNSSGTFASI